jgi:2-polyprenyl-6-methoxyphenol hydroxylase-like FAD-dependent oxidoreductase
VPDLVDVVVVGGGIAGGAIAIVLARTGLAVLVLERTTEYRDRVRGEWISPWGVVETQRLGLYDTLAAAGGHHVPRLVGWDETIDPAQAEAEALDLGGLFPGVPGPLCLGHPRACEALTGAAVSAGAVVLRGVSSIQITAGLTPEVRYRHDGGDRRVRCRLIVGADGRSSVVRQQASIPYQADEPHHLFSGLLVEDLDWPEEVQTIGTEGDVAFFVFPQGRGRARLYLGHALSARERFAGPDAAAKFLRAFDLTSVPASKQIVRAAPAGPCAAYTNEDSWADPPFADGVVLIGDAAGYNDPILGQGLSIAVRDVRLVSDSLLATSDWSPALFAPYADERRERMRRLRFSARLLATMHAEFGPAAVARRRRAMERFLADPELMLVRAVPFVGPDMVPPTAFTEETRARLFAPA